MRKPFPYLYKLEILSLKAEGSKKGGRHQRCQYASQRIVNIVITSYCCLSIFLELISIYKLARNRKIPCPHIFTLGRLALGVVDPAGALVPEGEGFEVTASFADDIGLPAELDVELGEIADAEPDGDVPAPVPGRTW